MRGLRSFLASTCIAWAGASSSFPQEHFCACMIGEEPVLRDFGLTVFAYSAAPGYPSLQETLVSAREAVDRLFAGLDLKFRWDLVPSAVLMQCRFLQAVGAAALGSPEDLSPSVRRGLVPVPLYDETDRGRPVYLFLNPDNPEGARLIKVLAAGR